VRALLVQAGHASAAADPHPRHNVAPMDLALVAALLEGAGWDVDLWDTAVTPGASVAHVARLARAKAPELLVVRPLVGCQGATEALLRAVPRATRLLLGPSAVTVGQALLAASREGARAERAAAVPWEGVLVGEAEGTFRELLPVLTRRAGVLGESLPPLDGLMTPARPLAPPRPLLRDLDSLPLPAHHLLMRQGYRFRYPLDVRGRLRIGYAMTSRGCAQGCVFCSPVERESVGKRYRWRSPESVVEELRLLRRLGANAVYFIDDFFAFSPRRVAELCEAMIRADVTPPWTAQVRAQGLDLDLLRLMRRAGCSTLAFGAESGSDRVLGLLRKGLTTAEIRAQAARIRAAGIQSVGYFIVGVPGETAAERQATYRLIEDISPDVAQVHIFNVYPGAPAMELYPELRDAGGTKFTGPRAQAAALERERNAFYRRYYLSPRYLARTLRRRWRPLLANLDEEVAFAWKTARFFLGARRGAAASEEDPS